MAMMNTVAPTLPRYSIRKFETTPPIRPPCVNAIVLLESPIMLKLALTADTRTTVPKSLKNIFLASIWKRREIPHTRISKGIT